MCTYGYGGSSQSEDWYLKNEYRTIPLAGGNVKLLIGDKEHIRIVHERGAIDFTQKEFQVFIEKIGKTIGGGNAEA